MWVDGPSAQQTLWVSERKPLPYLKTRFSEGSAQVSPDAQWLAYVADESGRNEVYERKGGGLH